MFVCNCVICTCDTDKSYNYVLSSASRKIHIMRPPFMSIQDAYCGIGNKDHLFSGNYYRSHTSWITKDSTTDVAGRILR